jgi:hypothetical protein
MPAQNPPAKDSHDPPETFSKSILFNFFILVVFNFYKIYC